jgi:hypothetical protein
MLVVDVRKMRMSVAHRLMPVLVHMRFNPHGLSGHRATPDEARVYAPGAH